MSRAIILAAGRGSRMGSMTEHSPKCLTRLNGRTLLDYQLSAMVSAGVDQIGLVSGYRADMICDARINQFFHNEAWAVTNMVSSLICADAWLSTEPCIVSYSDLFFETSAIASLMEQNQGFTLLYDQNWLALWSQRFADPLEDAETFKLNQGCVSEIGGKAFSTDEIEGQYMGIMKFTPETWSLFKKTFLDLDPSVRHSISMTEVIQLIIKQNKFSVAALPYFGDWGEIDSESDLKSYAKSE